MSLSDGEPFYMPTPDMFGHSDAYRRYTNYAAELEKAGLADLFPPEADLRKVVVELLAERYRSRSLKRNSTSSTPRSLRRETFLGRRHD